MASYAGSYVTRTDPGLRLDQLVQQRPRPVQKVSVLIVLCNMYITDQIWRITRWAKDPPKPVHMQIPPLQRQDGSVASTNEEKTDELLKQFFPVQSEANMADIEGYEYSQPVSCQIEVSTEEIQVILNQIKPDKAPEPDIISNRILKCLNDIISYKLAQITEACLTIGYCPKHLKKTITVT